VGGPSRRPTNPRWQKKVKSPYLCNPLTDFDEIWHDGAYWAWQQINCKNFALLKMQAGGGRHLVKSKNRDISATV